MGAAPEVTKLHLRQVPDFVADAAGWGWPRNGGETAGGVDPVGSYPTTSDHPDPRSVSSRDGPAPAARYVH